MGLPSCRGAEGGRGFGSVFRHQNSNPNRLRLGFLCAPASSREQARDVE